MTEGQSENPSLLGNRYQLQQTIGTGGMATVYLARDLMLERPVAIKLLKHDLSINPAFRKRFQQEARSAANLSHPNIVTVHDFGYHKGRLFIVMENVPGQNLKEIIRETGQFSIEEALTIIIQACAGIGYAHRAGLVHCDIKPHNILVTPDQRVKVTDFGIARALSSIQPDEHSDTVWGSPQYFSPEQASGLAPSPASDVYSLGVILYEMLTGRLPFESDDPAELAHMHREVMPVPPRQIVPTIPVELEQIILKVLSKEPSARYRTTDQFGRILETFLHHNGMPGEYPTNSQNEFRQNPSPIQQNPAIRPANNSMPAAMDESVNNENQVESTTGIDWITILLGLGMAISLGGLIPFWIYIWFSINGG
ncbi:MAG: protein kinase [Chloroflexi bacterium]|nr:protein kinase [Chloroflexota bacterium]